MEWGKKKGGIEKGKGEDVTTITTAAAASPPRRRLASPLPSSLSSRLSLTRAAPREKRTRPLNDQRSSA